MTIPTEDEKMAGETSHKSMGSISVGSKTIAVEINTVTTPNTNGGYDTVVKIPTANPIGAITETLGG